MRVTGLHVVEDSRDSDRKCVMPGYLCSAQSHGILMFPPSLLWWIVLAPGVGDLAPHEQLLCLELQQGGHDHVLVPQGPGHPVQQL